MTTFLPDQTQASQIKDTLQQMAALDELAESVTLAIFLDLLVQKLAAEKVDLDSYGQGVVICDRMTGRGVDFDVLFIPGLVQGQIPLSPREDPILTNADRKLIKNQLSHPQAEFMFPLKSLMRDEERLLFALAVDSARQRLYLSFSRFDTSRGRENFPSRFLMELCRIMFGKPVNAEALPNLPIFETCHQPAKERPGSLQPEDSAPSESWTQRLGNPQQYPIAWIKRTLPPARQARAVRELYLNRSTTFARLNQAYHERHVNPEHTAWDGLIEFASAPKTTGTFAVTALESYAQCPFRHWLKAILQVQPIEEPEFQIEIPAQVSGQIIHDVLKDLFDWIKQTQQDPQNSTQVQDQLSEILQKRIRLFRARFPAPGLIWDLTAKQLAQRLTRFWRELAVEPDHYQYQAGELELAQTLTFQRGTDQFEISIKGRIDRLDKNLNDGSLRIIDYKTGKKKHKAEDFSSGRQLQLPLYLKALLTQAPDLNPELCHANYLHLNPNGTFVSKGITGEFVLEHETELADLLEVITTSLHSGLLIPLPTDQDCQSCNFSEACSRASRKKAAGVSTNQLITNLKLTREGH